MVNPHPNCYKVNLADYFNLNHLESTFRLKLLSKDGGGRDLISPKKWWSIYGNNDYLNLIIQKCLSSNYVFTPYRERLVLKSRNKKPRVISIPSVRDRLVLCILNELLQAYFPDCVNHTTPNEYLQKIKVFIKEADEPVRFLKTDFEDFYGCINHSILFGKLSSVIKDDCIIRLIKNAIKTPTLDLTNKVGPIVMVGVPQGLAISNILASIYMNEYDKDFKHSSGLYLRYVDDILYLNPHFDNLVAIMQKYSSNNELNLKLESRKSEHGIIGENKLDYIGFDIRKDVISIRLKNIDKKIKQLASMCTLMRSVLNGKQPRPAFLKNNSEYIDFFINELNMSIAGFRYNSSNYGWVAYYHEITDLQLFYRLDKILKNKLLKESELNSEQKSRIYSFINVYYDINENSGRKLLFNFDNIKSTLEKKNWLLKKGEIFATIKYSEEEIDLLYIKYINKLKKKFEVNIGY